MTNDISEEQSFVLDGKKYISTSRASALTGYNADYIGQLAREGTVGSRKIGRNWLIDQESLMYHKKSNSEFSYISDSPDNGEVSNDSVDPSNDEMDWQKDVNRQWEEQNKTEDIEDTEERIKTQIFADKNVKTSLAALSLLAFLILLGSSVEAGGMPKQVGAVGETVAGIYNQASNAYKSGLAHLYQTSSVDEFFVSRQKSEKLAEAKLSEQKNFLPRTKDGAVRVSRSVLENYAQSINWFSEKYNLAKNSTAGFSYEDSDRSAGAWGDLSKDDLKNSGSAAGILTGLVDWLGGMGDGIRELAVETRTFITWLFDSAGNLAQNEDTGSDGANVPQTDSETRRVSDAEPRQMPRLTGLTEPAETRVTETIREVEVPVAANSASASVPEGDYVTESELQTRLLAVRSYLSDRFDVDASKISLEGLVTDEELSRRLGRQLNISSGGGGDSGGGGSKDTFNTITVRGGEIKGVTLEATTGIFSDKLTVSSGGAEITGDLTVNGDTIVSNGSINVGDKIIAPGEVGIGTSTTYAKLAVLSTDATQRAVTIWGHQSQSVPLLEIYDNATTSNPYFFVTSDGKTGIGTSSPATDLSVSGSGYLTGGLGIGTLNTTAGTLETSGAATLGGLLSFTGTGHGGIRLNNLSTTQRDALSPLSGFLVFNTTDSKAQIYNGTDWKSIGSTEIGSEVEGGTAGSVLFIDASGNLGQDNSNFFWNNSNKRLGIGTSSPASKLDVWGDLRVGTSSTPTLFAQSSTGRVGIGTTTPSSKLTVAGDGLFTSDLTVNGTTTISGNLDAGFTQGSVIFQGANGLTQNNSNFFWDNSTNRLGIGTSSPTEALTVNGAIKAGDLSSGGVQGGNVQVGWKGGFNTIGTAGTNILFLKGGGNGGVKIESAETGDNDNVWIADGGGGVLLRSASSKSGTEITAVGDTDFLQTVAGAHMVRIWNESTNSAARTVLRFVNSSNQESRIEFVDVVGWNSSITSSNADGLRFRTGSQVGAESSLSTALTIDSSQRVGIGTTSPASKLDVWGDLRVGTSSTPTLFAQSSTGRVGIGTDSPSSRLHLDSNNVSSTAANFEISSPFSTVGEQNQAILLSGFQNDDQYNVIASGNNASTDINGMIAFHNVAGFKQDIDFFVNQAGAARTMAQVIAAGPVMRVASTGNVGIGTTNFGTDAKKVLALGNATAPSTSIADGIQLYAEDVTSSSELKVRDEAGNITTLSPHNFSLIEDGPSEPLAWSFYSERDGRKLNVDMLRTVRLVEMIAGERLVYGDLEAYEGEGFRQLVEELDLKVSDFEAKVELEGGAGLFAKLLAKLSEYGVSISKTLTKIKNLAVGSADNPAGITIYDEQTGEPYCIKVSGGEMVHQAGECGSATAPISNPKIYYGTTTDSGWDEIKTLEEQQAEEETPSEPAVPESVPESEPASDGAGTTSEPESSEEDSEVLTDDSTDVSTSTEETADLVTDDGSSQESTVSSETSATDDTDTEKADTAPTS